MSATLAWAIIGGCLAAVIVAEIAVRAAAPRVAALLEWRDWECQHKALAIDALGAQGGASVVMIGSSPSNAAFDAHLATELLGSGRPAFNAALNAATIQTLELWTSGVVLPKLKPDLLVLGLNSSEVNDNNIVGERGFRMFRQSRGWRSIARDGTPRARLTLWLEDRSYLFRYRTFFREPGRWGMRVPMKIQIERYRKDWKRAFRRGRGNEVGVTTLGMLHALSAFRGATYELRERVLNTWREIVNDYAVGGEEMAALRRLLDDTRARGTRVLFLLMPVTQDWIDIHPRGREDFETFKRALDRFVDDAGADFVDLMPLLTDHSDYADAVHRNDAGQRRFTELVSGLIAERLPSSARMA